LENSPPGHPSHQKSTSLDEFFIGVFLAEGISNDEYFGKERSLKFYICDGENFFAGKLVARKILHWRIIYPETHHQTK